MKEKKKLYLIFGIAALFVVFSVIFFSAPSAFVPNTTARIEKGTSLRGVSYLLKEKNIIRSRTALEAFVILMGGEKKIQPAEYLFETKLPVYDVARRIVGGDHHMAPIIVTIPEGFDITEIAEAFTARLTNFNREKFLLEAAPKEGYLFPDTYFFQSLDTEDDVLDSMSKNFKKKIEPFHTIIADLPNKSENDIIVMASIIEREAKNDIDGGIISGILWKRLSIGMPLQVDAAEVTYKNKGLPQTPIDNPGLFSIKNAIYPEPSPYLYYLHDKKGLIHYAKTFAEHKANIAKYLK